MSYRHLLPVIAAFALGLTSCGDDAAEVTTVETVEAPVVVAEPDVVEVAPVEEAPVVAPDRAVANTPAIESDVRDSEGGLGEGANYLTPEEVRYRSDDGAADWSSFDRTEADGFEDADTTGTVNEN